MNKRTTQRKLRESSPVHYLTGKELDILNYIAMNTNINGSSPTVREIKNGLGLNSYGSMDMKIVDLIRRGFLTCQYTTGGCISARTLRVPDKRGKNG